MTNIGSSFRVVTLTLLRLVLNILSWKDERGEEYEYDRKRNEDTDIRFLSDVSTRTWRLLEMKTSVTNWMLPYLAVVSCGIRCTFALAPVFLCVFLHQVHISLCHKHPVPSHLCSLSITLCREWQPCGKVTFRCLVNRRRESISFGRFSSEWLMVRGTLPCRCASL